MDRRITSGLIVALFIFVGFSGITIARIDLTGTYEPAGGGGSNPFDQELNTTDDVSFDELHFNRIFGSLLGGTVDAGADPWFLSDTSLQLAENLTVNYNITASGNFVGNGSLVTEVNADTVDGLHVGTTGSAIADMSATNTWTGSQLFSNSNNYMTYRLTHWGDSNSYMQYSPDQIDFYAGSMPMLKLYEGGYDYVKINPSKYNIDFHVNGDNVAGLISTDANNDYTRFNGGMAYGFVYETSDYTMTYADHVVVCNGTFTVTLPACGIDGMIVTIKNYGTGTITIDGEHIQTIDGQLTQTLSSQYDCITLMADKKRNTWHIISRI